jgi:hypothetical protein
MSRKPARILRRRSAAAKGAGAPSGAKPAWAAGFPKVTPARSINVNDR